MKSRDRGKYVLLPNSVHDALEKLYPVPEPDPAAWEEERQVYLAKVQAYVRSRQEAGGLASLGAAESSEEAVRATGWRALLQSLTTFRFREATPLGLAVRIILIVGLILGGSVGTVTASRESLPGSPLYAIKVQLETWEMTNAKTPQDVAEKALNQSGNRVEEAVRLTSKGKDVPTDVVQRFEQQLSRAMQASSALEEAARIQTRAQISQTLGHQLQAMTEVAAEVRGEDGDGEDDPVRAMIRTAEHAQAQLGLDDDDAVGNTERTGPAGGPGEPKDPCEGDCDPNGKGPEGEPPSGNNAPQQPGRNPAGPQGPEDTDGNQGGPPDTRSDSGPQDHDTQAPTPSAQGNSRSAGNESVEQYHRTMNRRS